jgi:2-methylcitrate dehydratase PrpD
MSDYLEQLTTFICDCRFEDFPSVVVERAREVVADSLAVIATGAQEEEVKKMTARMVPRGGREVATIIGTTLLTEPAKAALINGTAGTFLELDEGNQFGRGHPGIHVIAAALAVSEENRFSGRDFLTALVLGYEIGTRIGIACKLRMSMHPHGTWGTVGAAVAVGKLMGYGEKEMREIINVSSSLGLATSRRTMLEGGTVRNVYAGVSNYMGILAHDLVQSGFTGEADGLKTVFGSVVSDAFSPEAMVADLGTRYEIARNYFKRHACCRYNHGTLDALGEIVAKRALKAEEIARVDVKTYSLAAQLCDQNPQNMLAGKFSVPFAVATAIVHGSTGVESFRSQVIDDPAVKDLALRVFVTEDPKLTAMMPKFRPSRVKVQLKDGSALEAEALTNKGDTEDPYSGEELQAKYFDLARLIWKREVAEAIHADAMQLETLADVRVMTGKLRKLD